MSGHLVVAHSQVRLEHEYCSVILRENSQELLVVAECEMSDFTKFFDFLACFVEVEGKV